MRQATRGVTD